MKILLTNLPESMEGFNNLAICAGHNLLNLDDEVADSEAQLIVGENILNYICEERLVQTVDYFLKKLSKDGQIILGGIDYHSLCRAVYNGQIDMKNFNHFIFGESILNQHYGLYSAKFISGLLEDRGLKITKESLNHDRCTFLVGASK